MPDARTPKQKKKDVDAIMEWLREPKDSDRPDTSAFQKVDQLLPKKPGETPKD
jgi:hypothetical protein